MDAAVAGDAFNTNTVMDVSAPGPPWKKSWTRKARAPGSSAQWWSSDTDSEPGSPSRCRSPARAAVERMQEEPHKLWQLVVKAGLRSGIGSSAGPAIGQWRQNRPQELTQEQYMKIRAENPALLGLRPQKGKR